MPPGTNAIQTRQRTEELFRTDEPVTGGSPFVSEPREVDGYASVSFLGFSDVAFQLRVEEACELDGPYTETHRFSAALNDANTDQQICRRVAPCGSYMRITVAIDGGVMNRLDLCGIGIPIADITEVDVMGSTEVTIVGPGGSPSADVRNADADDDFAAALNGLVTNTRLAIFDGTNWNRWEGGVDNEPGPSLNPVLAFTGGIARAALPTYGDGDNVVLNFDTSGRLQVTGFLTVSDVSPGTTVGPTAADTAIGVAATVPLPVPPVDTRRMTVENTGPAGSFFRVRELGGIAGSGFVLARFSSISFGGADGAIASLEAEEVIGGIPTSATVIFERD